MRELGRTLGVNDIRVILEAPGWQKTARSPTRFLTTEEQHLWLKLKNQEEEKIVKENVQKRFKDMFSGENETALEYEHSGSRNAEARVTELEEKLGNQPGSVEKKATSTTPAISTQSLDISAIQPPQQENIIYLWRERLVNFILRGSVGLGFIGLIITFATALQN